MTQSESSEASYRARTATSSGSPGRPQGAISRKHLERYLSEFRFNRRTSHAPTHLFQRLMEGAVRDGHHPYDALVGRATPLAA